MSSDIREDSTPLCILGPGGDFRDGIHDSGSGVFELDAVRLTERQLDAVRVACGSAYERSRLSRMGVRTARGERKRGVRQSLERIRARAFDRLRAWLLEDKPYGAAQIGNEAQIVKETPDLGTAEYQPDAQAIEVIDIPARFSAGKGLLTDYAGVGRRVQRQQGYRLRAHRNSASKRIPRACAAQGTLFEA